jgi:hypothetical protein
MKKTFLTICFFILFVFANASYAENFGLEPYIKIGTLDSSEENHPAASSHKVMTGIGINAIFGEEFKKTLGLEYWTMAEPTDEDREVPSDGIALSGRFSYDFYPFENTIVYPFAGLGLEGWRRNSPLGDSENFYGDLFFADASFGIGAKHKGMYCEAGGLLPFWADTDTGDEPGGKLGFIVNAGFVHKKIDFGLFYSQKSFEGDGSQTDFQLKQYGLFIGYRF